MSFATRSVKFCNFIKLVKLVCQVALRKQHFLRNRNTVWGVTESGAGGIETRNILATPNENRQRAMNSYSA